jgi:hypothetical protein
MKTRPPIYGLLAEFTTPEALVEAAKQAYKAEYRRMDAYSPMPVDGLAEAIGFRYNRLATIVLIGGLLGGATAYGMMWFSAVIHYPLNVGGRPLHSWPSFIPITFELTVLGASIMAVLGMLGLNGLPTPHHPLFNVTRFERATRDRFFLCIEATDPRFDRVETRRFLDSLGAKETNEVPY